MNESNREYTSHGMPTAALLDAWVAAVESRCAAGALRATEDVLDDIGDRAVDDESLLELIYAEVMAREETDHPVDLTELQARFPKISARLARLWAVHTALERESERLVDSVPHAAHSTHVSRGSVSGDAVRGDSISGDPNRLDDLDAERVGTRFGAYELLERVGQGGMGVVYRARDHRLGRTVAIKLLRRDWGSPRSRNGLMNEARAAAQLQHPDIVSVFEVAGEEPHWFLVLEWVPGGSLDVRLNKSTLSPEAACHMLQRIARAVDYAHDQGIIHRDLKPGNILLGANDQPKITDFGLAKILDHPLPDAGDDPASQTEALLGTLCYMAPEQLGGAGPSASRHTDIYSLGAILYQALVGRPPLVGDSPIATADLIRNRAPMPLRQIDVRIPCDVETICLKCLEKLPGQRYATATELADELQRFLEGRPIEARPIPAWVKLVRWSRRRPLIAALSLAVALLVVIVAMGGYAFAWNQQRLTAIAKKERDAANLSQQMADQKAAEAAAINQFMVETLRSPHPSRDGRQVTIAERLHDGLQLVDDRFPEVSPAKATLLHSIGYALDGLGLYDAAGQALEPALEIRRALLGQDDSQTLETAELLGDVYRGGGSYQRSIELLSDVYRRRVRRHGTADPLSLHARLQLANALSALSDRQPSLSIFDEVYLSLLPVRAEHPLLFCSAAEGYGQTLRNLGELERSRDVLTDAVEFAQQQLGADQLPTIRLQTTLAGSLRAAGDYDQARRLYESCQAAFDEQLGPEHSMSLSNLNNLAVVYADLGDHAQAENSLDELFQQQLEIFGLDYRQTLLTGLNLAIHYERTDQLQRSRELFETVTAAMPAVLGEDHPETLVAMTEYAKVLGRADEPERAIELLQRCIALSRDNPSIEPSELARTYGILAFVYEDLERYEEAIDASHQSLQTIRAATRPNHPQVLSSMNNHARIHRSAGDDAQAIELYRQVIDRLHQELGAGHLHTIISELNLGICYRDCNRPAEAIELLRETASRSGETPGDPWIHLSVRFQLARALLDAGQWEPGLAELDECYQAMQPFFDPAAPSRMNSVANQLRSIVTQLETAGSQQAAIWQQRQLELSQRVETSAAGANRVSD